MLGRAENARQRRKTLDREEKRLAEMKNAPQSSYVRAQHSTAVFVGYSKLRRKPKHNAAIEYELIWDNIGTLILPRGYYTGAFLCCEQQ